MKRLINSFFCLSCLLAASLWAQVDSGTIAGTIQDSAAAAIPKAVVTITETETNNRFTIESNGLGEFVSPPLKVGTYAVSIEAPGFKTYTQTGIALNVQDRLRGDAKMEVGRQAEQVNVTSEIAPVQTDTSSLGEVVTAEKAAEIPMNGRNYVNLASLTAGVVATGSTATNGNTAGAFSSNGTRGDLNNYMLDGIDNNNNSGGSAQIPVNVDAIAEFKIQTNSYDAEFGRSGGAALNVVIKSGTNDFHGSAFDFFQNGYVNAENFFATTNDLSSKDNQPGGTFGVRSRKTRSSFSGTIN